MKPIRRPRISVERLEARDCPSFTISLQGSTLNIYGVTTAGQITAAGVGGFQVNETAANTFTVLNGTVNLGHYVASNVSINLFSHIGTAVNVNLEGNTLSGNLSVNTGLGDGASISDALTGVGIVNGTIAGNLSERGGDGNEFVNLGGSTNDTYSATLPGKGALSILGNVYDSGKVLPTGSGNNLDTGLNSTLDPADFIGGSVVTSAINGVSFNPNAVVGGSFTANGSGNPFNGSTSRAIILDGRIGGNVSINGAPGSAPGGFGDNVVLGNAATSIGGNFNANLGGGNNQVFLLAGTIGGSANVTTGNGNSTFTTGGVGNVQVNGSLSISGGNGNNTFSDLVSGQNGISSTTFVNGSLNLRFGNGNNTLSSGTGAIASTEFGNLNVNLGNGNNPTATLTGPVFGTVNWTAGNGTDSLTLPAPAAAATATSYNANVLFGSGGANSFTLGGGGGAGSTVTLTGNVNGGSGAANVFNQLLGGVIGGPWMLSNFP